MTNKPTNAFIEASYIAPGAGLGTYLIGLWNSSMVLNEKGFYFIVILFGLYSAVLLQKCVRDRTETIPVSQAYYSLSWVATIIPILLLIVGLFNATTLLPSEKGFYGISFLLALFGAITVQKNTRNIQASAGGGDATI